ncbi:hypothetical protein PMAYCL1PPCAC_32444 [Pristionchus mayeri]|uniref:Cystatin domain-containing protein n=1 Tax=Pristionchus mayeri TaxID=1317129 RepID=A0AAN5IF04_9BILA|nr:hypothetical protein PMAYCL1PPCAC_32444 [Pristionchus mayeri]
MQSLIVFSCVLSVAMSGLAGGFVTHDPSDAKHLEKVWRGVKDLNEGSSDVANLLIPIKVVSARSQVVAGIKWEYEVLVGESDCPRRAIAVSQLSKEKCALKKDGTRSLYKIAFWEKPWENFEQFSIEKIRSVASTEHI